MVLFFTKKDHSLESHFTNLTKLPISLFLQRFLQIVPFASHKNNKSLLIKINTGNSQKLYLFKISNILPRKR